MLEFSPANAKIKALRNVDGVASYLTEGRKVYSLDLLAGHTCPGAKDCLAKVVPRSDDATRFTIKDGKNCKFRCFSASQEVVFSSTRKKRARNTATLKALRSRSQIKRLILNSLPTNTGVVRYHVSGDFYKRSYLQGAIDAAKERPDILFYAYTKSLHFLEGVDLPANFLMTASRGGKYDHLIKGLKLREAIVVYSEEEAQELGLPIDHTDEHAATHGGSFALLVHGPQKAKSAASIALTKLKGKGSYSRKKK